MNLKDIEDILEQFSREHTDVQHGVGGKSAFVRLENHEHLDRLKNKEGFNLVLVAEAEGYRIGERDDKRMRWDITIRFACYAGKALSPDASRNAAKKLAEEIMFDFQARLEQQQEEDEENCGPLAMLVPEKISWAPIEDQPWFLNHFGYDMVVPFESYTPGYRPEKWLPNP